jgi:CxxC motif-containing protein
MVKSKEMEVICIRCPLGCRGTVVFNEEGNVEGAKNYQCKEGRKYVEIEGVSPMRVFTGTVITNSSRRVLLPVRSEKPISKDKIVESARLLSKIEVRLPIKIGEVIVPDIMRTGVNIISSLSLDN